MTNKYLVEAIVFLSYVLFAMAWVGGTASMSQIMANMEVTSLASASFISGAVTFAKIVGTFCAAWFALKLGVKGAFFASCLLVSIGILTPYATSYDWLLISRFLMGLGGALMIVYFNPIVMNWFAVEERATINGLNAVAFNVGTAIVLWSMADINAVSGGWQNSLTWFSALSGLLAIAWLFVRFSDKEHAATNSSSKTEETSDSAQHSSQKLAQKADQTSEQTPEPSEEYSYKDGLTDSFNWAYALTYSGLLAFYICLFTFYPSAGISASKWVIGAGIVGTMAGMVYSKNIKQRVPVIKWSGLIQTLMVVGLSFTQTPLLQTLCAIVLGFFIFFPITALVSIPHESKGMSGNKITVVFSLFWSISYLIATVVLWLFGVLVDLNQGEFYYAFIMISIVSSSFFIGSFFLPETNPPLSRLQQTDPDNVKPQEALKTKRTSTAS